MPTLIDVIDDKPFFRLFKAALTERKEVQGESLQKFKDFAGGYQNKLEYYKGRMPTPEDNRELQETLVIHNVIGQCLDRIVSSALRYMPTLQVLPRNFEDGQDVPVNYAAVGVLLEQWLRDVDGLDVLKAALKGLLYGGRSYLRVFIPSEYGEMVNSPQFTPDLQGMLEGIHLQVLDVLEAGAIRNHAGIIQGYYYLYEAPDEKGEARAMVELHTREKVYQLKRDSFEVVAEFDNIFYDPEAIRRPRFMLYELSRPDSMPRFGLGTIAKQQTLNEEITNARRNSKLAAYRQWIFLNVMRQASGEGAEDEEGKVLLEGRDWMKAAQDISYVGGAGRIWEIYGVPDENDIPVKPEAFAVEPVRFDIYFQGAIEKYIDLILEDFSQGFIKGEQKAVSAVSKRESRKTFDDDVKYHASIIEQALREVMARVLELAFVKSREKLEGFRVVPTVKVDIPDGDMETFNDLAKHYLDSEGELVSKETVLKTCPAVDDVQAELQRIVEERGERVKLEQAAQEETNQRLAAVLA